MDDLIEIINLIKANPFFYFSLASKENFHSNFWKWLSTLSDTATFELFLPEGDLYGNLSYNREYRQQIPNTTRHIRVDLLIKHNDLPIVVIENKVKDFAKREQLSDIQNSFNDPNIQNLLITL